MIVEATGIKILLVDDDALLRTMATQTLRHAGFDVAATDCGSNALQLFAEQRFDLILLDVIMPGIDGFEVCRLIRSMDSGRTLPILMLTGLNDTNSIEDAFRCGATDFVTKPINWTLLSHRVRYCLRASVTGERAARDSERLERAQQIANMGSWQWLPRSSEFACSSELDRIFNGREATARALTFERFAEQVCVGDRKAVRDARDAAEHSGTSYDIRFIVERVDGERRTLFEQAVAVMDSTGEVVKVEGITQDITERVEAERRIHELAFYDRVTGLPNRELFAELARPALDRERRLGNRCAMLHIDLDHFKSVNDAFGHDDGDVLLRMVAGRLQESVRGSDLATANTTADGGELLARVGGNSFIIMIFDIAGSADASIVATRLLEAVAQPIAYSGREALITASVGIAVSPRDADDVPDLIQKAEQALYAAKAAGRATHRFFDRETNALAGRKLALASDLRRAIDGDELRLFLQPKVDATNGAMVGAEGLVRWQHPSRGMLSPDTFIPIAEELGLIVPLSDWVVRTACATLRHWRGVGIASVPLSINMSTVSFRRRNMLEELDSIIQHFEIEPQQLTLEVTESVLVSDPEQTIARMHALRERGFGLSLDDFGTGFSSLSYLKMFPIDELKIDRSFVRDITEDERDAALVGSIIALGAQFKIRVVAEGVETAVQAAHLVERGCHVHQGYFFARPMPLTDFEALLARSATLACVAPRGILVATS
jgi:diguanylate cyclase (GGDEF)-like protein